MQANRLTNRTVLHMLSFLEIASDSQDYELK